MNKVYRSHTTVSSFHSFSALSEERKLEIIKWIENMDNEQRSMLNDLLDDVRAEEQYYADESEDY